MYLSQKKNEDLSSHIHTHKTCMQMFSTGEWPNKFHAMGYGLRNKVSPHRERNEI